MRRMLATTAVLLSALTLTTACGEDDKAPTGGTEPEVIDVVFEGDTVSPSGERVEVARGQDVDLAITADAPGEIHVHSDPEVTLEYTEGTTTVTIPGIDQPGTVDVESHNLDKVIVQLEVS